ncbi:response regulator transcription factor [Croceicoccus ponticola]|nr:response regulator [Croceicoccus ponticola]
MLETTTNIQASIIEDDAAIRKLLSRILDQAGIRYREFGSAEEYLNDNGSEGGIIILDLQLPGISGLNFLSKIRNRGDKNPVIVLTGGGIPAAMDAIRLGAVRYIGKPFTKNGLMSAIDDVLGNSPRGI